MLSWLTSLWSKLNNGVQEPDEERRNRLGLSSAPKPSTSVPDAPPAPLLEEAALGLDWNPCDAAASDLTMAPPLADEVPSDDPILGIDLGTTHAVAAVMRDGRVEVIPNQEGENLTPSVVAFTADGRVLVGAPALRQATLNPRRTVYSIKRRLGRGGMDGATTPYEVVPGPDGAARIPIDERSFTPAEITALILRKLLDAAQSYLGRPVRRAVLTVPACFDDAQRQATLDAALLAGLDVQWVLQDPATHRKVLQPMRVITEPTAAALALGLHQLPRKLIVLHMGGGTFDISILETGNDVVEVRVVNGATTLGGDDFDQLLIEHFAKEFAAHHAFDPRRDPTAFCRLKDAAEQVKKDLSLREEARVRVPYLLHGASGPAHLDMTVTRAEFERLAAPLLERCRALVLQTLQDAKYRPGDIDEILLIGGMTRMPRLRALFRDIFGREASGVLHPDEAVAIGAAVHGAQLALGSRSDLVLIDVAPLTLGVETPGGAFTAMIRRNTKIPCEHRRLFTTTRDDQPGVSVRIFQGDSPVTIHNRLLAQLDVTDLPPQPRGRPRVAVVFAMDHNGVLRVTANELASGRTKTIRVAPGRQLSVAEATRLRQEAEQNATPHHVRRALIDARNRADLCLYHLEELLRGGANQLDPVELAPLRAQAERARQTMQAGDAAAIHDAVNALEPALQTLAAWLKSRPKADRAADPDAFSRINLEI